MTDFYIIWCAGFKYDIHFSQSRKEFSQNGLVYMSKKERFWGKSRSFQSTFKCFIYKLINISNNWKGFANINFILNINYNNYNSYHCLILPVSIYP